MQTLQIDNKQKNPGTGTNHKTSLTVVAIWTFFIVGSVALLTSIIYVSSILAFIGLSLIFWGAILLYIQPEEYTKKALLDSAVIPSLETLNQIVRELNYKGKAVYLPPKYLKNPEASKVYISKQKEGEIPEPELTLKHENQLFFRNPQGILLTPPGAQLLHLFEKQLDTNFTKTDITYITQNLPKLLIEDLEIAENIDIDVENNDIKIKITNSTFKEAHKENNKLPHVSPYIGCPLSSAIACALTKATGKPITIENIQASEDGKIIETTYQILGKIETEIKTETYSPEIKPEGLLTEPIQLLTRKHVLPNLASLLLTATGSITLAQVAWITWYDITVWGKDVTQIFLGSRTSEAISLGIGLRIIHYFLIGLALLLLGLLIFFRRKEAGLPIKEPIMSHLRHPTLNLASLFLTSFGLIILIWVGWLTWYDLTVWSKDITSIFLGSRVGEAISLGIGMKVIYYFLIGLASFLSGILTYIRR
jgi:uncharacterized protein YuzE